MCSDIELFINLIYMTDIMDKLQDKDFNEYLKCIELTQDWEKFNNVQDIVKLNNSYINKALIELYKDKRCSKILKEETDIDISVIEKILIK